MARSTTKTPAARGRRAAAEKPVAKTRRPRASAAPARASKKAAAAPARASKKAAAAPARASRKAPARASKAAAANLPTCQVFAHTTVQLKGILIELNASHLVLQHKVHERGSKTVVSTFSLKNLLSLRGGQGEEVVATVRRMAMIESVTGTMEEMESTVGDLLLFTTADGEEVYINSSFDASNVDVQIFSDDGAVAGKATRGGKKAAAAAEEDEEDEEEFEEDEDDDAEEDEDEEDLEEDEEDEDEEDEDEDDDAEEDEDEEDEDEDEEDEDFDDEDED